MVTYLFSVHSITEAKQYAGLGKAEPGLEPGLEPGQWIFQPRHINLAHPGVAPPLYFVQHFGYHFTVVATTDMQAECV